MFLASTADYTPRHNSHFASANFFASIVVFVPLISVVVGFCSIHVESGSDFIVANHGDVKETWMYSLLLLLLLLLLRSLLLENLLAFNLHSEGHRYALYATNKTRSLIIIVGFMSNEWAIKYLIIVLVGCFCFSCCFAVRCDCGRALRE